jgi:CRISPR-associated protein Csd1
VILPALIDYYDRLAAEPDADIAPFGFSRQNISFIVVLEGDGKLHAIQPDFTETDGRKRPRSRVVPGQAKPSGQGLNPCLLWDNTAYLLGYKPNDTNTDRTAKSFEAFRDRHLALKGEIMDPTFDAVCGFLKAWSPQGSADLPALVEIGQGFGVFQIRGQTGFVHESAAVLRYWKGQLNPTEAPDAVAGASLLNNQRKPLARLHEPKIKGVVSGQSAGTVLVGFNEDAFTSYGKSQSYNAPLGEDEAFKYCTSLNRLLADQRRRAMIGDATVVFWSAKPTPFEDTFTGLLVGDRAEDQATINRTRGFAEDVRQGQLTDELGDLNTPFFVLGLSPNAARVSVRYWLSGTVGEFARRLGEHLRALDIVGARENDPPLTIRRIVNTTARLDDGKPDYDSILPRLAGDVARAVLGGRAYPNQLLAAVVARVGADGVIDHPRAAVVKACLIRKQIEVTMALDETRTDPPYLLGRLFATLEKTQEDAYEPKLNRTIKDGYFSSASATPASVFPRLCRLSQHHIERLEGGMKTNREKLIQRIVAPLGAFPRVMRLEEQGLFFIGYYHQRQDLFTSKKDKEGRPE